MSSRPRPSSVLASIVLLCPVLVAGSAVRAVATAEMCGGQPATIVVSSEPDAVEFGTDGHDVVVVTAPQQHVRGQEW
jgi:hypothetical protein